MICCPPAPSHTVDEDLKARYSVVDYRRAIRSAVRGLWRGYWDQFRFTDIMRITINQGFTNAWLEGAEECDVYSGEYTEEEIDELADRIFSELLFVPDFGYAIVEGSRANKGLLRVQFTRAELWIKRYQAIKNRAMVMSCGDRKLIWKYKHEAKHCPDCLRLDGQIRRASVWREADLEPQSPRLECVRSAGGVSVCRCHFETTDQPATRGHIPYVHG